MTLAEQEVRKLFSSKYNSAIDNIEALAPTGSYRQYFRISDNEQTVLGVFNEDLQENKAYLSFSETFINADINVPSILAISETKKCYLVEDMGKTTLWDLCQNDYNSKGKLSEETLATFKLTLQELLAIQTKTIDKLDLSYCYPRDSFDKQSMLWDLNYFKYMFLRVMRVPCDEQALEDDIQRLSSTLDKIDRNYFLFRDFQSRNVMIKDGKPYFIDFQGGRKGSIYYDLASMLYDANIKLCITDRKLLLDHYYDAFNKIKTTPKEVFLSLFNQFAMIRLFQALGAFSLRGVIEKKPHFKECIPFALSSLKDIIENPMMSKSYPELKTAINKANKSDFIKRAIMES